MNRVKRLLREERGRDRREGEEEEEERGGPERTGRKRGGGGAACGELTQTNSKSIEWKAEKKKSPDRQMCLCPLTLVWTQKS